MQNGGDLKRVRSREIDIQYGQVESAPFRQRQRSIDPRGDCGHEVAELNEHVLQLQSEQRFVFNYEHTPCQISRQTMVP